MRLRCQCPHGLVPHCYTVISSNRSDNCIHVSMPSRASTSLLPISTLTEEQGYVQVCQCPHGLVPHCYRDGEAILKRYPEACQCPHGLVPHCYHIKLPYLYRVACSVSMPSRASTSLLLIGENAYFT